MLLWKGELKNGSNWNGKGAFEMNDINDQSLWFCKGKIIVFFSHLLNNPLINRRNKRWFFFEQIFDET